LDYFLDLTFYFDWFKKEDAPNILGERPSILVTFFAVRKALGVILRPVLYASYSASI
jgi:hypothetical protein